ncbi:MAG: hypothetical protein LBC61_02200 [Candidatus Peribacteria bacterium]|jgi:hypothetical protein|nr:hypothetical protein [Candidatus Peribacteria bacterium]
MSNQQYAEYIEVIASNAIAVYTGYFRYSNIPDKTIQIINQIIGSIKRVTKDFLDA